MDINVQITFHQKVIIFNKASRFLALKASYKGQKWDLPGGAVEIPETALEALQREVKEETNIVIENIKPLVVESAYNETEKNYVLFVGYQCTAEGLEAKLSNEHTEYRWVTKEDFLQLDSTPYLKDFVQKYL